MALFMEGNQSALILWSNTIQYSKHIIALKTPGTCYWMEIGSEENKG